MKHCTPEEALRDVSRQVRATFAGTGNVLETLPTIIDQIKREGDAAMVALSYVEVKGLIDTIDDLKSGLTKLKDHLQYTAVPEAFENAGSSGMKSLTTRPGEDGLAYNVVVMPLVRASIKDKDAGIAWLRSHELGDIVTQTVNANTLASLAKSEMEEGRELPEDIFSVHVGQTTRVTAIKTKK